MLSTRFSGRRAVLSVLLAAGSLALAGCATGPTAGLNDGIAVDPGQPVRVALLVPYGTGDPARDAIARSLENAARLAVTDLRDATIDLAVYPSAGTTAGGAAAAQQAVAEGAKIIVGPLFSTETAGAQSSAAAAGLTVLSLSNNPSVAGGNVFILGTSFENTAGRLVGFGQSRGMRNFGVVYPAGLEGETARDAVAAVVSARGATLVASQPYNLSVEGIQAAAGPAAAALLSGGAQAVILTDGPTGGLGFIAEALRSNGVGAALQARERQRLGRGVPLLHAQELGLRGADSVAAQTQFLGMQQWDASAEALALPSLQGGAFAAPDPSLVAAFEGRYRTAYGEGPHELAGLAFDGVHAVGAMIAEARASGGSPFSGARLTEPSGFAGAYGPFRLLPNGRVQRNLAIVEVRGGSAVVIERASRSFDAIGF